MIPLFLVLLLRLPLLLAQNCPYGCECVEGSRPPAWDAVCSWLELPPEGSPFSASSTLRSLRVLCSSSTPHSPSEHLFRGLQHLNQLSIEGCVVSSFPGKLFSNFSSLRHLELILPSRVHETEQWLSLPDALFHGLPRLQRLEVRGWGLRSLPSSLFCSLPHLQVLNVSGNSLSESWLSASSSCTASQLIIVDLSHNGLRELLADSLSSLPAARHLLLSHNSLSTLHSASFNRTPLLQHLDLDFNSLRDIGFLPQTLVSVDVAENDLESLPESLLSLPSLVFLNASGNRLSSGPRLQSLDLETVDFSRNALTSFPLFDNATSSFLKHLLLARNHIKNISVPHLHLEQLASLDISSNGLTWFEESFLSSLSETFSSLDLSNNSLKDLPLSSLSSLSLRTLDLSFNQFSKVPLALSHLARCNRISLRGNEITAIAPFLFSRVPQLEHLDLSRNKLQAVGDHELSDCPWLTSLSLSANHLHELSPASLHKCDSLRFLDISVNRLSSFSLPPSLSSLRRLNISSNALLAVDWDRLPTRTEFVFADNNKIERFSGTANKHAVRVLSLNGNALEGVEAANFPPSLERLSLSGNILRRISPGTLANLTFLQELDVSESLLEEVSFGSLHIPDSLTPLRLDIRRNPLLCSCQLSWMEQQLSSAKPRLVMLGANETLCTHGLDGRKVEVVSAKQRDLLCNYTTLCDPGCGCCGLSLCDCRSECPPGCRCFHDSLHSLNLVRCQALSAAEAKAFSPRSIPMYATHVYLSGFPLQILRKNSFIARPRLLQLHINSTGLAEIEPNAFNKVTNLELLDLSGNLLRRLHSNVFNRTVKVTQLFLNDNHIEDLDESVSQKLENLQLMTLHNNALMDIPASLPHSPSLLSVSLAGNPFRCDCDASRFVTQNFLLQQREKIIDADLLSCVENVTRAFRENDTTILSAFPPNIADDIFQITMNDFLSEMNSSLCVAKAPGVFGSDLFSSFLSAVLAFLIIFFLFCGSLLLILAIFAKRRRLQSRYAKAPSLSRFSSGSANFSPLPLSLPSSLLSSDVFVSYSLSDEKMHEEDIIRRLKDEDFLICLLHQDGPKYEPNMHVISDELTRLMRQSSAVVMLITRSFVEREWEKMEISLSHKDVNQDELPSELGKLIRKNTVIKRRDPLFLNLFDSALPLRLRHSLHSDSCSQIYSDMYGTVQESQVV